MTMPDDPLNAEAIRQQERESLFPPGTHQDQDLAALCLSGGGIRSATFGLGVLQAMARFGLLEQFHFLSTVSGGGYIGGWLTAWRTHATADKAVFAGLDRCTSDDGAEAPEITGLRANSNYLTPRLGILSADTWAALALMLRNVVLNWLVFGPLFLAVLLVPKCLVNILLWLAPGDSPAWHPVVLMGIAGVMICAGLAVAVRGRLTARGSWLTDTTFLLRGMLPLVIAAMALTGAFVCGVGTGPFYVPFVSALLGAGVYGIAWAFGFGMLAAFDAGPEVENDRERSQVVPLYDFLAFVVGGIVAGAMLGIGAQAVGAWHLSPEPLVVFGLTWVMLSFATGDLVFVGVNSFALRGEQDREWLARFGGWILAAGLTWAIVSAVDIYLPKAMGWGWGQLSAYVAGLGVSGVVTLVFGGSAKTGATTAFNAAQSLGPSLVLSCAAILFAVSLAAGLSAADSELLMTLDRSLGVSGPGPDAVLQFCGGWMLILLSFAVSWFVNVNRFSLHALYRNRLTRAYLGSARPAAARRPDPFSAFDPTDNLRLHATLPKVNTQGQRRLLHVVNMTLNTVATKNLAWQERRAESFTATALHAGNARIGYRDIAHYGGEDGLTLATAMAISGAAVSPNMGYNSSPLIGMLLSLFNLRLGWWLGNTGAPGAGSYRKEGPQPGFKPALQELAGRTTDDASWIYLSDGGHFDNLGVYEMVQRRCRTIVVIDAGHDPQCAFEDLGNAARKIYIDFGISINFSTMKIAPRQNPPVDGFYCAQGTITYPDDGATGWLLYIKPGYHGAEPPHVRSYAIAHKEFPHESTAEQWFSESQFEAYRALGAYITEAICTGGTGAPPRGELAKLTLEQLKFQAKKYLARKLPAATSAEPSAAEAPKAARPTKSRYRYIPKNRLSGS